MSDETTRQLALLRDLAIRASEACTVEEACALSASSLAASPEDLHAALVYLAAPNGSTLSLVATVGMKRDAGAPQTLDASSPLAEGLRRHELLLVDDSALATALGTPHAVALPLATTAGSGLLVVGLGPDQSLDESRRGFLLLVAGQIAASLSSAQARSGSARVDDHDQFDALEALDVERAARARLTRLFAQAPIAIAVLKGPGHIFDVVNTACSKLLNRRAQVGRSVRDCLPELVEQGILDLLDRAYATGEQLVVNDLPFFLDRDGDGVAEETCFSLVYQPLLDKNGRVEGALAVGVDVTPQVEARRAIQDREERLRVALDREQAARNDAERANRTKDEFLAMLGHELRNPLAPISTALHLMRLRGGPEAEKERSVIERQVNYLVRLVDDLLDVSRITQGKVELKRERIEIAEVIAKAIETASPLLEQRQHRLTVDVARFGLPVDVDPTRMAQVLANLLTNAAKYTEPRGTVAITVAHEAGGLAIRVRDTGIGIAKEMLTRVFELFTQERQALDRSHGGLGLGLAIVRSLVTLHGGRVEATSDGRGCGSEFTVHLPLAAGAEQAANRASSEDARPCVGRRVLIVDDNSDAAEMLAETLAELGFVTRVAHDGPSALRVAAELHPDVAVLDIGLPVMDGYELARRLRELPALDRVRLIAVTGYGQDADRRRSAAAGFDSHLVKPITLDAIEAAVTDAAMR